MRRLFLAGLSPVQNAIRRFLSNPLRSLGEKAKAQRLSELLRKIVHFFSGNKKEAIYGLLFLLFIGLFVEIFAYSESPSFCGLCHNMKEYVESWKTSSHNQVSCLSCHRNPGFLNHVKGKWVDFQLGFTYLLVGKGFRKLHYEVDDGNCLKKGCHKRDDLKGEMIFKNVSFPHGKHLGELRRGMILRCTTCHAQLVQGLHLTVHETNCFVCHFYRAGPKGEEECVSCAVGGCTSCHVEPKGDINVKGWNFNHRRYIARGVACERCHVHVIQGDGHVPEGKCLQCHHEPEILNTKYTSQFMHKNHVTDHKIECVDCHAQIQHEIRPILTMLHSPAVCDKCHSKEIHLGPRELYRGSGGFGVPDSPSLMFATNVDCVACHRKGEESQAALMTTKYAERVLGEACVECHGEGYDETLNHWKSLLSRAEDETNRRIFNVQKVLYEVERTRGVSADFKKAEGLLNKARHNYSFVLLGKGVHNVEYAFKLLNAANNKTEQALAVIDKNYESKEFKTQMTCTTLCHVGMEKRTVSFNDTKFPHKSHAAGDRLKCGDCHSSRETHGKTFMKNCATCHHGKKIKSVKCDDCHISVKRLVQGKGGIGVKERPSNKLDVVECMDCHRGVLGKQKETFEAIKKRCIECHDRSYGEILVQWRATSEGLLKKVAPKLRKVREEIERIELRRGHTFVYRKLFGEAELNFNLVQKGNGVHNLEYSEDLLETANHRLEEAIKQLSKRK